MYGPSYQMYPYGPPQQRIPAPSSVHHVPGPRHSVSQSTLRSRPSVGTSAGTSRNNTESGPGSGDSGRNRRYKWDASTSSLDPFSAQYRSQSRSQTSLSQKPMDPYQQPPWPPPSSSFRRRAATVHAPDNTGPVIPDIPPDIEAMFRKFGIDGQSGVASRSQPTYAPGRAYGAAPPIPPPGWSASGDSASYGSAHLAGPPPGLFGGWSHPSASSFAVPPPAMFGPNMPPPVIPSIPSGYRPSQYGGSSASSGAYAKRSSGTGERRGRDRRPKPLNARDRTPPPAYLGVASSQADSTVSDPLIHPALGWWPDQRRPALYWDLSSSSRPRYTKREFDPVELIASPFTPPLSHMRLVLDPHAHWVFDISALRGESCITLSSLLKDISSLMRAPNKVPHAFWVRATTVKKEAILRAMLRRTGRTLSVPPPYRRPKSRGQIMEEAVVDGAPNGWTNLLVVDLLCEDVMFAGMEFHKGPDEWILRTTKRYS